MAAIAKEPRVQRARPRPQWWAAFGWAAAAAMIVVVAAVWNQNTRLKSSVEQWAALSEQRRVELDRARRIVGTLIAQDAKHISVLPVGLKTIPEGKVIYSRPNNALTFPTTNFHPLPAQNPSY